MVGTFGRVGGALAAGGRERVELAFLDQRPRRGQRREEETDAIRQDFGDRLDGAAERNWLRLEAGREPEPLGGKMRRGAIAEGA